MAGDFGLATFLISLLLYSTLAADSFPPKITFLWHGGMSDNYGNQPLGEYAIDPRQAAVFNCDADGIPEPVYVWTKNGDIINSDERISFEGSGRNMTITNPETKDNGSYQCNATSSRGTALSQEIEANLAYLDMFIDPISSYTRQPNDKVIIPCKPPNSFPKLKINWAKKEDINGKYEPVEYSRRVSQSTTGDLIIGDVVANDRGFYVCQVNNMILSKIQDSSVKSLTVSGEPAGPRKPTLISYPESQTYALAGLQKSLKCIADGYETPDIVWEDYPENDRFSTASFGQELVITNVELSDSGDYTCVAVSGTREAIKSFELIVEAAPYWTSEPNDVAIAPGETAIITCDASGVPPPSISWLVNGAVPATVDRRDISGNTVTITAATTEDNSVYQCVAENKHGKIMGAAILSVNVVKAKIVTPPEENKEAAEGESVTLQCGHIGRPYPVVTWEGKSGQISDNDKYTVNEDGSLTIKNVVKADEGDYTCKVVNKGGEAEETGSIVFRTKTTIVEGVPDKTVEKPNQATLTCTATHDDKSEIVWSWTANGKPTGEVTHGRFRYNSDRNTIDILNTKVSDSGEYCCTASTTFDSAKSCGNLTVQGVPTAPYDVKVVGRGDAASVKRKTIFWQPSNPKNSPITEYIIEFNTTYADFEWREMERISGADTSTDLSLFDGLTYFFRVIAVNGVGNSAPSQVSNSIKTPAAKPVVKPSNVVGQSEDPNTMVISWDPVDVTDYGGDGFSYKVEYKNTSSSVWMDKIVPAGQSSTTVMDTKVYQEFQIKVTAINDIGDGPAPDEIIIGFSGEGTPQAAPGNVNVNVTSPNSALVTFDPVSTESLQGKLKYYRVYYTESAARVSRSLESVECVTPSCEVNDLKPSTDYDLHVVVANGKKEGPPSETQRFSTPEAPPGQPLNFEIVMLSKKMKLFWAPSTKGGEADSYQVKYSPKISEVPANYTTINLGPTQIDCIIEDLTPETTYIVSIKGYNTAGFGPKDLIEKATGKSGIPSVPTGIKVKPGKDEAIISWSDDPVGPSVEKHIVKYRKADGEDTEWMTKDVHAFSRTSETTLTNLAPNTRYELQLVAMNEDQQSTDGPIKTFTTSGTVKELPVPTATVNPDSPVKTAIRPGSTPVAGAQTDTGGFEVEPWLIVMICIILLLLIILIILCYVRSQKGGKYNVSDKEDKLRGDPESAPLKDDEGGFEEYKPKGPENSQPLPEPEEEESSDEDSLAGYADGITGNFDEDGSFIGQYSDKRKKAEEAAENNAMQSLV